MRPYYHLAMRVLARAVLDVMDPTGSAGDRESARAFLAGSVMMEHWCQVAALDPAKVHAAHDMLTGHVARGEIAPMVWKELPLADLPEALAALESRASWGKIVVIP